jgi:hypothetical protein
LTSALQYFKTYKPYTLAGFEPGIFSSGGGRDGHYATPPGQINDNVAQIRSFFEFIFHSHHNFSINSSILF